MTDGDQQLPVEYAGDELVINTSEDTIDAINDVAREREQHSDLAYISALRKVVRHAQAPWFDPEAAVDQDPADPDEPDEDALAEEVKQLESELEEQDWYARNQGWDAGLPDLSDEE